MSQRVTIEEATRALLGRDDEDDEDNPKRDGRPPRRITLPRVKWLDKPGPEWVEPPKPAPRRTGGRK
jgi:hypothetical protein